MHYLSICAVFLLTGPPLVTAADRPDLLLADFEGDTYGDWKTTGTAVHTLKSAWERAADRNDK